MKLDEIAKRINAHLKRFESDPVINADKVHTNLRGQESRLKPYYCAGAAASGRYVFVMYVAYQGEIHLTKDEALRYLAWLDAGNVGKHWEALKASEGSPE
jgi:hypothetical protein